MKMKLFAALNRFRIERSKNYDQKFGKRDGIYGLVAATPENTIKMDEDGCYVFLPDYPKEHLLLELPLDKSTADLERAQKVLESYPLYQDCINQANYFESGNHYDPQSVDDILEIARPYEERGDIPTK